MNIISRTRLLLADDHAVVRSGLRRMLEQTSQIEVVAEAESGERAWQLYDQYEPDIAVIDMSMPGLGGLGAIKRIKAKHPNAKLIGFSMFETPSLASQVIKAGGSGYVSKSGDNNEIIDAIKHVIAGKIYISPSIAQKIAIQSMQGGGNPLQQLTANEYEILRLFAEGRSAGEIADILKLSPKTVSNNYTLIKQKLGVNTTVEMLRLAMQHGIIEIPFNHMQ